MWTFKNTGEQAWPRGFKLTLTDGRNDEYVTIYNETLEGEIVAPGQTAKIKTEFKAP